MPAGDTLSEIAARLGSTVAKLMAANKIKDPDRIYVGQRISTSGSTASTSSAKAGKVHTVRAGETLSQIAATYHVSTAALAKANGIDDPDRLAVGTKLTIPTSSAAPATAKAATKPTTPKPTPKPAHTPSSVPLVPLFTRWSAAYAVPRDLLEARAWKASDWQPGLHGPDGREGIMQFRPSTVAFVESGLLGRDIDPLDPSDGIQMGARYLRYLLDRTVNEREAVAAWRQSLDGLRRDGITAAGAAFVAEIEAIRAMRR
ncbi:MAG: LysM peptidoglycan-binding domain-containing protein [Acidimicrobiales bacterium]